jgi:hypothetical protein
MYVQKYCIVVNKYISLIFLIVAWPKKLLNNEIYFVFLYILWYSYSLLRNPKIHS